jgi:sulfur-oxidizing protein SoxY
MDRIRSNARSDPNVRFDYGPYGATQFRVEAVDTDGHVFKSEWPVEAM